MIPKTFVSLLSPAIYQNILESLPGDQRLQTILSYRSAENLNGQRDPLQKKNINIEYRLELMVVGRTHIDTT